jgi:hypothetical protein
MTAATPQLILATSLGEAMGGRAAAAAVAVAVARSAGVDATAVCCWPDERAPRPTLLASRAAREAEARLSASGIEAAARGSICVARLGSDDPVEALARLLEAVGGAPGAADGEEAEPAGPLPEAALRATDGVGGPGPAGGVRAVVAWLPPEHWRAALDEGPRVPSATLVRAERDRHGPVAALLALELRARRIDLHVLFQRPGTVASRRALAGLEPGGPLDRRARRLVARLRRDATEENLAATPTAGAPSTGQAGQALPLVLGTCFLLVLVAFALALIAASSTAGARLQRAADLAAVSAARSMRDDYHRVFEPAALPSGLPNPRHLSPAAYRARAARAARLAAERNGAGEARVAVRFLGLGPAPTRVRVTLHARAEVRRPGSGPGREGGETPSHADDWDVRAAATAEAYPVLPPSSGAARGAAFASGGGYAGPLAYRGGEGMRPDVARAYDRLRAAAARAGHAIYVNSGYRSDAEQARLFAANPNPRMVAPPGRSLHRCGTELDLGPPSAYAWLAANAPRFGFVLRYPWEPWHFGYVRGPAPCSPAAERAMTVGRGGGAGRRSGGARWAVGAERGQRDLPGFVPARFRRPLARAAARYGVSAPLLAAQLMAESGFNPLAVSPAGARGIAQFMPATAAAYGLRDPFDPIASINAQARLMRDLLGRFGSPALALAAYNAGPAAVAACNCIPPYPETRAYVARVLGLLGGAGLAPPPLLEVRLVA